jgi:hypothetical protein
MGRRVLRKERVKDARTWLNHASPLVGAFSALTAWAIEQSQDKKIAYCPYCKQNIIPEKRFNWLIFIFLCGFWYLPIYLYKKKHCPICGSVEFLPPKFEER